MRVSLMLHSTLLDHIQLLQVYNTVAFYPSRPNIASAGILYCYILPFQTIYSFCRYIILLHSTLLDQIQLLLYIILLHSTLLDHIYSFCMYIILLHSILSFWIIYSFYRYIILYCFILLLHSTLVDQIWLLLVYYTVAFHPSRSYIIRNHKEMESARGPVMDLPDRLQVQEAPSRPCSNWTQSI